MSSAAGSSVEVVAIDTPALGDRSYLAHDGEAALVVDPQRDIDRVLDLAAAGLPLDGRSRRTGSSAPRFPAAGTLLRFAAGERHIRPPA